MNIIRYITVLFLSLFAIYFFGSVGVSLGIIVYSVLRHVSDMGGGVVGILSIFGVGIFGALAIACTEGMIHLLAKIKYKFEAEKVRKIIYTIGATIGFISAVATYVYSLNQHY